jgi:competence protein ComEA
VEVRRRTTEWVGSMADRLGVTAWSFVVGSVAVLAAGIGGWWAFAAPAPPPVEEILPRVAGSAPVATATPETIGTRVVVHVDGAVVRPGVHDLPTGSRVIDAIEAAGGLSDEADRERLNLAAPVSDGQRVWIPRVGEDEPPVEPLLGGDTTASGSGRGGPVNLNTADSAALETLPGVGPSIAAAIISFREKEGPYERVDDLLGVAGIGPSRLAQIADLVTV